jgi:drug/metabolite transporter (DMT)-like permease
MISLRLIFVAIVWGVNFAFVKFALHDFAPLSFTIVRFSLAALFLVSLMLMGREPLTMDRRDVPSVIGLGLIGITFYNLLFMYGLKYTTASNSALFISSSPLFAVLVLALLNKARISTTAIAGLICSSIGVFLIIASKPGGIFTSSSAVTGDLLTLGAALFWALYTVRAKPLLEKYSALKVTAYSMASGTIMLLPLGVFELRDQPWETISFKAWSALLFSAIVSGGVAFTLWYDGVKKLGVTRTSVYHYLVPFVAVLFAALFLGEPITVPQVLGGMAILAGVALVQQSRSTP